MKGRWLLMAVLFGIFNIAQAQIKKVEEKHVPRIIYKSFGDKYPKAHKVEWAIPDCDCYEDWEALWEEGLEMENLREDDQPRFFHVTYKYDNKDRRDIYFQDGEWIETRTIFNKSDLPMNINKGIANSAFKDWNIGNKIVFVQKSKEDGQVQAFYKIPLKDGLDRGTIHVDLQGTILPDTKFAAGILAKEDLPKVVFKSFGTKYPQASKVEWYLPECDCYDDWKREWEQAMVESTSNRKEDPENFYVRFQYQDKSQRSIFYRNGEWMETEIIMNTNDLPAHIISAVKNSEYSTWKMPEKVVLMERPLDNQQLEAIYTIPMKGGLKKHKLKVYADGSLVPRRKLLGGEN